MNNFYRKQYTIIEMLVVISILGVLIAMGAPAAIRMISKNKTTVAKQEVQAIVQAIKAFESEYGKLPLAGKGSGQYRADVIFFTAAESQTLVEVLLGLDSTENPRDIKFLKWNDHYSDASISSTVDAYGTPALGEDSTADNWIDPWGNPYVIAIDYNYDNIVSFDWDGDGSVEDIDSETLRGNVFVFSKGESGVCGLDTFTIAEVKDRFLDGDFDSDNGGDVDSGEISSTNSDTAKSW